MKVVVENLTGALFYVQLDNDATVADLKREIEAQHKLPCDRMILILDDDADADSDRNPLINKEQEERSSLVDCGVQDGSHIYLFFNPLDDESSHHFGFNWPDFLLGTLFYVELGNDSTVADLKREIEAQEKLPSDHLILILDAEGSPLINQESSSLVDCGVQDWSHIYLFIKPLDDHEYSHYFDESSNNFWFDWPDFPLG